jgi:hypothetical protein
LLPDFCERAKNYFNFASKQEELDDGWHKKID